MAKEAKKVEIPSLVVQSKAKEFAKTLDPDIRMSSEFLSELNEKVAQVMNDAVRRCRENKRGTLKPADL